MTNPIMPGIGMNLPATAGSAANQPTSKTTSTTGNQALLDPQAFLKLLVAQLQYQDPSSPVDTASFMNQTAMLSQVQTMATMSSTLTSLSQAQQIQAAADLVGKTVTYTNSSGAQATGMVSGASVGAGTATLKIGGATVPLSSVTQITATTPSA